MSEQEHGARIQRLYAAIDVMEARVVELQIDKAYELYDSDPRVHGIHDKDAFRDALIKAFSMSEEAQNE